MRILYCCSSRLGLSTHIRCCLFYLYHVYFFISSLAFLVLEIGVLVLIERRLEIRVFLLFESLLLAVMVIAFVSFLTVSVI